MRPALWPAALAAGVCAVYLLRLDLAAGLYVDDAWYIVLAKALANGDGYALVSSAAGPILPAFPPGFPLLLAPVFALNPSFPDNVLWLKAISIAAMFGVGFSTYLCLRRLHHAPRLTAGAVALLTVVTPAFVFLATSTVMAECVFALAQLGVVLAVDGAVSAVPARRFRYLVLGAVLGASAFLIRTAGIASLLAGAVFLGLHRGRRPAAGFIGMAAVCCLPWVLYASAHRPNEAARLAHGGSVAHGYTELLLMRQGGNAASGRAAWTDLPARVGANLVNIFGRDMGAVIIPAAYRGASESGLELVGLGGDAGLRVSSMGAAAPTMALSWTCSVIVAIGLLQVAGRAVTVAELLVAFTVGMVVLVPAATFRYILPLAPFLLYYFLSGIEMIAARFRRVAAAEPGPALRIGALCLLLLLGMEHAQYVWQSRRGPLPLWLRDHQQVQAVADWMNRSLEPGHVASTNPGLVYLLTGRLSVGIDGMRTNAGRWSAMGVRYVAAWRSAQQPPASWGYRLLFALPGTGLWVAEVQAPPAGLTGSASPP